MMRDSAKNCCEKNKLCNYSNYVVFDENIEYNNLNRKIKETYLQRSTLCGLEKIAYTA